MKDTIIKLETNYKRITNEIEQIKSSNELLTIQEIDQMMKDFFEFKMATNELLSKVIDKIVIDKEKNIEIYFKLDVSNDMITSQ